MSNESTGSAGSAGSTESTESTESKKSRWEQTLRDAATHLENDLRSTVNYINDEVVPEVRRNGSSALRDAAVELRKLADRMEEYSRKNPTPPPPSPKDANRP